MARTRTPYKTATGNRVPSVTTILGQFKDPGALMYWSWNVAFEQLQNAVHLLEETKKTPPRGAAINELKPRIAKFLADKPLELGNFRSVSGKAADAGTFAHDLVEMWIHAKKGERLALAKKTPKQLATTYKYPLDIATKAHSSFQGFIEWAHQWKLTVVCTEEQLVSDEYRFGGTVDCVAKIGSRNRRQLVLLDWKTSKAVYGDYLCQVAAYGLMWMETYPERPLDSYHLVRFDKETGDYHHHQWQDVTEAAQLFLLLRQAYDLKKEVDKRAK